MFSYQLSLSNFLAFLIAGSGMLIKINYLTYAEKLNKMLNIWAKKFELVLILLYSLINKLKQVSSSNWLSLLFILILFYFCFCK